MYTAYSQNIDAAFLRLPKELQLALDPIRQMLSQTLGRCDASLAHRGNIDIEGGPTITLGPNVTVNVKGTDGTLTEVDLTPTALMTGGNWLWAEYDGTTSPTMEDTNADGNDDHYLGYEVRMWGGTDPGASPDLYDIGMLKEVTLATPIYAAFSHLFAVKGYDGNYYVVNGS